jgi:hypothetical protein
MAAVEDLKARSRSLISCIDYIDFDDCNDAINPEAFEWPKQWASPGSPDPAAGN